MRVLLTTDTVGGVWTFTQELTAGLLRRGHAVTLATFGRMPCEAQNEWLAGTKDAHGSDFDTLCTPVPLEWMEKNELAWQVGARFLQGSTLLSTFDVLHSNQFCYGALDVNMPRLITAHSDVLSWAASCLFEPLPANIWLEKYLDLVHGGLRGAHALTAPSQWMLDALTSQYSHVPEWQEVIFNGRTLAASTVSPVRTLQAVSVGRLWDEGKNIQLLAGVKSPVPLLVAGDQNMENASAPAELGAASLLGALAPDALFTLLRSSAMYIATSVYEPFGLAPLEAALCGCALLLHDIPSFREIWGDNALYFRNAEELSGLLQRLADSSSELQQRQQLCNGQALHFSADRMVDDYVSLYERLIRGYAEGRQQRSGSAYVH